MRKIYILVVVIFLLSLFTGIRIIEPGERAVVLRFGRVLDVKTEPGLYVGLPWGIDQVYRVQVQRIRSVTIGYVLEQDEEIGTGVLAGQLVTGDHNLVNIQAVIDYVVREEEVEWFVFQQDRVEELLLRTGEAALSQWVASQKVDDVILKGKQPKLEGGKTALLEALVQDTQERLKPYKLGVKIQNARITLLSPPAAVKDAFDEVYAAYTQIGTQKTQADTYAKRVIDDAAGNQNKKKTDAKILANDLAKAAQGQTNSFDFFLAKTKGKKEKDANYLTDIWWDQVTKLYDYLDANGQIMPLDQRLGSEEIDFSLFPWQSPKK